MVSLGGLRKGAAAPFFLLHGVSPGPGPPGAAGGTPPARLSRRGAHPWPLFRSATPPRNESGMGRRIHPPLVAASARRPWPLFGAAASGPPLLGASLGLARRLCLRAARSAVPGVPPPPSLGGLARPVPPPAPWSAASPCGPLRAPVVALGPLRAWPGPAGGSSRAAPRCGPPSGLRPGGLALAPPAPGAVGGLRPPPLTRRAGGLGVFSPCF